MGGLTARTYPATAKPSTHREPCGDNSLRHLVGDPYHLGRLAEFQCQTCVEQILSGHRRPAVNDRQTEFNQRYHRMAGEDRQIAKSGQVVLLGALVDQGAGIEGVVGPGQRAGVPFHLITRSGVQSTKFQGDRLYCAVRPPDGLDDAAVLSWKVELIRGPALGNAQIAQDRVLAGIRPLFQDGLPVGWLQSCAGLHHFDEFRGKRAVLQEEIVLLGILVLVGVEKQRPASVSEDDIVFVAPTVHLSVQIQTMARDIALLQFGFTATEGVAVRVMDQITADDGLPPMTIARLLQLGRCLTKNSARTLGFSCR